LTARWSTVEGQGERLTRDLELLQRLEGLKGCLEGSRLAGAEELKPRLAELGRVQLEQREEGEGVTAECLGLVQQYNDIIGSLTEAFVQVKDCWTSRKIGFITKLDLQADVAVTKAEQEAGIQPGE
jgi:hypothetical protein